eukprot:4672690-Alexandrium_andersonii.AAC.1
MLHVLAQDGAQEEVQAVLERERWSAGHRRAGHGFQWSVDRWSPGTAPGMNSEGVVSATQHR